MDISTFDGKSLIFGVSMWPPHANLPWTAQSPLRAMLPARFGCKQKDFSRKNRNEMNQIWSWTNRNEGNGTISTRKKGGFQEHNQGRLNRTNKGWKETRRTGLNQQQWTGISNQGNWTNSRDKLQKWRWTMMNLHSSNVFWGLNHHRTYRWKNWP